MLLKWELLAFAYKSKNKRKIIEFNKKTQKIFRHFTNNCPCLVINNRFIKQIFNYLSIGMAQRKRAWPIPQRSVDRTSLCHITIFILQSNLLKPDTL